MVDTQFKIGDPATNYIWTDRHAGFIIDVSKSGKKVTWQRGTATRTDNNGMSDCQSYDVVPNPKGVIKEFSLRKRGDTEIWKEVGTSTKEAGGGLFAGHREYYDYYSF